MVPFLQSLPAAKTNKKIKRYLKTVHRVRFELPCRPFNWHKFISEVNFIPCIIFLSGGIAAFHYKKILKIVGKMYNVIDNFTHWLIRWRPRVFHYTTLVSRRLLSLLFTWNEDEIHWTYWQCSSEHCKWSIVWTKRWSS